jgi:septal ring factor EnvC (AmiA/AmiB activator)
MEECERIKELMLEMFTARDKATKVALDTLDKRLDSMNEFRNAMADQASHFIRREEHDQLAAQINEMQRMIANFQGRYAMGAVIASLLFTIAMYFAGIFRHL